MKYLNLLFNLTFLPLWFRIIVNLNILFEGFILVRWSFQVILYFFIIVFKIMILKILLILKGFSLWFLLFD